MSHPCSSCGRFAFAKAVTCYWCRSQGASAAVSAPAASWEEPVLDPIELEQRRRAKLKRDRMRRQQKKAAGEPPVQETLI